MSCCEDRIPYYNECSQEEDTDVTGCVTTPNTSCITYDGDGLECLSIETGAEMNDVLDAICVAIGEAGTSPIWDGATDVACLLDKTGGAITTWKEFAEGSAKGFCDYKTSNNAALATTNTNVTTVTNTVAGITNFSITGCDYLGITGSTTNTLLRQAFATKICDLDSRLSLAGINWDACFTTVDPTTIAGGFSAVLAQICAVKTIADSAVADTYKVKYNSGDAHPDYLVNKIADTPCIVKTLVNDGVQDKVGLALSFTPKYYTFSGSQFDTTLSIDTSCVDTYTISLKDGLIPSAYELNCDDLQDVFVDSPTEVIRLYGNSSDGCVAFTDCSVRNWIFDGYDDGSYMIVIDNSAGDCSKVTLQPMVSTSEGGNPCAALGWTSLVGTLQTGATDANLSWTAASGGSIVVPVGVVPRAIQYRWSSDGSIEFRGGIAFNLTQITSDKYFTFTVNVGTIDLSCMTDSLYPQEAYIMNHIYGDATTPIKGIIRAVLYLDSSNGNLRIKVFVNSDSALADYDCQATLDGISFKF